NPKNRDIIDGKAATGAPVGGKPVTKNAGFTQMALFVNKRCKDSQWNAKTATGHWATYKKLYIETQKLVNKSGWGLTEDDHEKGITTIEAKLEELCPYYSRIDAIYDDINLEDESDDNLSNIAGNNNLYDNNFNNNYADNNDLYEDNFNNNNEDLLAESNELSSNCNKRKHISEDISSKRQHLLSSSKNKNAKNSAKDIYFNTKQQSLTIKKDQI
ncbi:5012_t:CDS:2, partial [Dentiscutata erythropus]